jgi:hypothetical protein
MVSDRVWFDVKTFSSGAEFMVAVAVEEQKMWFKSQQATSTMHMLASSQRQAAELPSSKPVSQFLIMKDCCKKKIGGVVPVIQ